MDIALYPIDCSERLALALAEADIDPKLLEDISWLDPNETEHLGALVVELGKEPMRRLRKASSLAVESGIPVLVVAEPSYLALIRKAKGIADFLVGEIDPMELSLRVERLVTRVETTEILNYHDLQLNTRTYQSQLGGKDFYLTYMEYELLRFLVENQGRVWSRTQLLSKVWGLDYFGGARTVDVHIRRLRIKLGEDRDWIVTVRSVGYRLG